MDSVGSILTRKKLTPNFTDLWKLLNANKTDEAMEVLTGKIWKDRNLGGRGYTYKLDALHYLCALLHKQEKICAVTTLCRRMANCLRS